MVKRLARDGWLLPIPQPKDQPYLYMPNPALINTQSSKIRHFLGIVDLYITLDKPEVFEVEPWISDEYRPDALARINNSDLVIELQRSIVSNKKMQDKVDLFVKTNKQGLHQAKSLLIVTDYRYDLEAPTGYEIIQRKLEVQ